MENNPDFCPFCDGVVIADPASVRGRMETALLPLPVPPSRTPGGASSSSSGVSALYFTKRSRFPKWRVPGIS